MKGLMIFVIAVLIYNVVFDLYKIKQEALHKVYDEAWQQRALEKYQWKKNRLRVYTELVYNAKYGVAND